MTQLTLYHNPRCSKSRAALALLEAQGASPRLRLYLDDPPSLEELRKLLKKLKMAPREVLRRSEAEYTELQLDNPALDDVVLLQALAEHPRLLERPIAVSGNRAVVGRPPENVLELLS